MSSFLIAAPEALAAASADPSGIGEAIRHATRGDGCSATVGGDGGNGPGGVAGTSGSAGQNS
jgi:hypothetical protein